MTIPYMGEVENQKPKAGWLNNAMVVNLAIAVSLFLLSLVSWFLFGSSGESLKTFMPILGLVVVALGIFLVQQGRSVVGISLSLAALAFVYLFLMAQFGGIGAIAGILFTLVAVGAVMETFPKAIIGRVAGLSLVVGLVMIVLDLFWPGTQRPPLPREYAPLFFVATATGLVVVVYSLRRFPTFTLHEKMVTAFLAVSLVPLIFAVALNNSISQDLLIWNANQRLQAAAKQTAVSVDDFLVNSLQDIRSEAALLEEAGYLDLNKSERSGSQAEASAMTQLRIFLEKDPQNISSYALLDTDGRVVLEYPPDNPPLDESGQVYATEPIESQAPYVSGVQFTPIAGGPFLYFSAPVYDQAGDITGVVRARYKASILQQQISRNTGLAGDQSFAVLFDENLLYLAHGVAPEAIFKLVAPIDPEQMVELGARERLPSLPPSELTTNLPELAVKLREATDQPFFSAQDVATGERIDQVAAVSIEQMPWLVAFFQPQEIFLAPIEALTRTAVILAVAVTLVVILIATFLAGWLTKPITHLKEATEKVARGDLNVRAQVESDDEIGSLAKSFNLMAERLQETLASLERRVADRTQALVTSTEVGRRLSTILDQQQLVSEVVDQVQKAFGYYHVHIYLFDESGQRLIMVGGSGEPGRIMLHQNHFIPKGKGLVGRAADLNVVVVVPDVSKDPHWLANPLLPRTKSEIAVPISIGERVLGVLDVQDDVKDGLQQQDAELLLSISNQLAIALQNAWTYAEIQRQAERRALINEINRKIRSTYDAEEALKIAVREIGRAVSSRYTRVWLNNQPEAKNGASSGLKESREDDS